MHVTTINLHPSPFSAEIPAMEIDCRQGLSAIKLRDPVIPTQAGIHPQHGLGAIREMDPRMRRDGSLSLTYYAVSPCNKILEMGELLIFCATGLVFNLLVKKSDLLRSPWNSYNTKIIRYARINPYA